MIDILSQAENSVYGSLSMAVKKYLDKDSSKMSAYQWAKSSVDSSPESHDCNFVLGKISYDLLINETSTAIDRDELKNVCFQSNIKAI